jgi:3-oxoacyl-[acyl-carrier protein] reductase
MKVALVTGASRGLGAVMAQELASAGWAVAVNYASDTTGAESMVAKIRDAGGRAHAAKFSVIDESGIARGIEEIKNALGPVDLIVNNATGPQPEMPLMEQSWRTYLDQIEFFVKAPLELLQAVLPDWRARKVGRVINIGSEIAELGNPNFGNYASAKTNPSYNFLKNKRRLLAPFAWRRRSGMEPRGPSDIAVFGLPTALFPCGEVPEME